MSIIIIQERMESTRFFDKVSQELVDNGIVPFTIHDSVIVKREYAEKTLEIMKSNFLREFGVDASFHVDPLNPGSPKVE